MTDTKAPERIWAFYAPEIEEDNPQCTIVAGDAVMHGAQQYVRADLYNELLRTADELAKYCDGLMGLFPDQAMALNERLTAYKQAKARGEQ